MGIVGDLWHYWFFNSLFIVFIMHFFMGTISGNMAIMLFICGGEI